MTKEQTQKLHTLYGAVTAAVTVLAGVCLAVQCVGIYRAGAFSREAVAVAFAPIAAVVYACLALVAGGFLLSAVFPREGKGKAQPQSAFRLRRMLERVDITQCDSTLCQKLLHERESRRRCALFCGALQLAATGVFLVYALNGENFHRSQINGSMIRAMYLFLPCLAVSFACGIFCLYHSRKSMEREIGLLKSAPKGEKAPEAPRRDLRGVTLVLIGAAIALTVIGYAGGGFQDVLTKAVNICTECIGLG